ncbi:MAG: LysM peptidoglycan-binding domain-containing protein [Anaerolineae bacterium]|nr:MAG: LysM peptidoglycan-binding domain-containing protein [Anaerolineae bacterium]
MIGGGDKMDTRRWQRRLLLVLVVVGALLAGMLLAGCKDRPTPTPTKVFEVQTDCRVRRELAEVWAGSGDMVPQLTDGVWRDLSAGDLVTTDNNGEGWVKMSDCMLIYVFQDSGLIKAACPRSDYSGGNVTCAMAGTSVYNNSCASQIIIQTLSAEVVLEGTWLSVTYIADQQLTVIMVFEGQAEVRPVQHFDARTLAETVEVVEGHFWFSAPGVEVDPVAGLAAREPHPFDRLPPLIEALDLGPWLERIKKRAEVDKVPFPDFSPALTPTPAPLCRVVSGGLNLRPGPGTSYSPPIRTLAQGTELVPLEFCPVGDPGGQWIKGRVLETQEQGWISANPSDISCEVDVTGLPRCAMLPTPTPTLRPTFTPIPCGPPPGWTVRYTVRRGDTLYSLARHCRTTVSAVRQANCLTDNTIYVGQRLWLPCRPIIPVPPTATYTPAPADTPTFTPTWTPTPTYTPTSTPTWTPTPTPTRDVIPPLIPTPLEPGTPEEAPSVDCPVTLRWTPVSDPSGVVYQVSLETYYAGYDGRISVDFWHPVHGSELSGLPCESYRSYRWHVRAEDGAGNWSGWSYWLYYQVYDQDSR